MAGPLSTFLPLSNNPIIARVTGKQIDDTLETTASPGHYRATTTEVELSDKDDDWYDTSSTSEDTSPVKMRENGAATDGRPVAVKTITAEEEAELLPYMPTLFSNDLPPCGPEVQVAYTIVISHLRQRWFNGHGQLSVVKVVHAVASDLDYQNRQWPPGSVKGKFKRRKPWCREIVFKYQLYWIAYFIREAQAQSPELMTESELLERKKEPEVPPELRFSVQRNDVLKLWESWNAIKRKSTPALPEIKMGDSVEEVVTNEDMKEEDDDNDILMNDNNCSAETIVQRPKVEGLDDDASMWSHGGHD